MAASMVVSQQMTMIQEPTYCRLKLDINAQTEDALIKGKRGLLMLPDLKSFHEALLKESKLIQTVIRIRQAQLRREKVMQLLKRIKACLQRIHLMDKIFTIADNLLGDVKISLRGELGHLPCKQTWTFLLYLIVQYHGLLHQTVSYSLSAFQYLTSLITVRQLLQVIVIFMGICSRVWQVCKTFSDKLTSVYNLLYPIQQCMQASKSDWVWPELPIQLMTEKKSSHSENGDERACEEFLTGSIVDSTRILDCTACTVDALGAGPDHSDSEEDIGVAVNIEECQKETMSIVESSDSDNLFVVKKRECEETGLNKNRKKKKKEKKSIEFHDTNVQHEKTVKERKKKQKRKKKKLRDN